MPPQDNPSAPDTQPQTPAQTEPPRQTNPSSSPLPEHSMDQNNPSSEPFSPGGSHKKLLGGIIAAVVIVAGLAFLFLSPLSPLTSNRVPTGPQLLVEKNPYHYACALIDNTLLGEALNKDTSIDKQAIIETSAFAPANTADKELNILKTSDEEAATSSCRLLLDRKTETDSDGIPRTTSVEVLVQALQYDTESSAKSAFSDSKKVAASSEKLEGFDDKGYYTAPAGRDNSGARYVKAYFWHKNIVFELEAATKQDDASGSKLAGGMAQLGQDIIKRMDKGQGTSIPERTGIARIGDTPFIDACTSPDYVKVTQALSGGVEFTPNQMQGVHALSKQGDDETGLPAFLASTCAFSFRTKADADNQAKISKDSEKLTMQSQYPHNFGLQFISTASSEDAKKYLEAIKQNTKEDPERMEEAGVALQEVKLGNSSSAFKLYTKGAPQPPSGESEAGHLDNTIYYAAHDSYVYVVSAFFVRQAEPYKTTAQKITDGHAAKIIQLMQEASQRGERK